MEFLHLISKKVNRLTEKRRIKVTQNAKLFTKLQTLSIVKYVNLKIMKLMWRENLMY